MHTQANYTFYSTEDMPKRELLSFYETLVRLVFDGTIVFTVWSQKRCARTTELAASLNRVPNRNLDAYPERYQAYPGTVLGR